MDLKSYLVKVGVVLVAILAPIQATLLTTLALVVCDMITGMIASVKRGERITSAKMRNTLSKLFIYEMLVAITYFTEVYLLKGSFPLSNLVTGIIALTETKSLIENCEVVLGTSIFDSLIQKLASKNLPTDPQTSSESLSKS